MGPGFESLKVHQPEDGGLWKAEESRGPLVKRLRHRPLTPVTWVRFPYGSPQAKEKENLGRKKDNQGSKAQKACYTSVPVPMTVRIHPFPSRTRKLSSSVPTILGPQGPGKIGRRRHTFFHSGESDPNYATGERGHQFRQGAKEYGRCLIPPLSCKSHGFARVCTESIQLNTI